MLGFGHTFYTKSDPEMFFENSQNIYMVQYNVYIALVMISEYSIATFDTF
jgi:hypothetical protein